MTKGLLLSLLLIGSTTLFLSCASNDNTDKKLDEVERMVDKMPLLLNRAANGDAAAIEEMERLGKETDYLAPFVDSLNQGTLDSKLTPRQKEHADRTRAKFEAMGK